MRKGRITEIQRASVHDGAGIRTTVFLKGCPLSCKWCHNPECISFEQQILEYPENCIGCGQCSKGCFSGAKVLCGTDMTAEEVLREIRDDVPYYGQTGGVTISGGEPMAQPDFVRELIALCRKHRIGCAMETSLIRFDGTIFEQLDFVMADLKLWDSGLHRAYTGVPNEIIKENFIRLNGLNIPIIARTPVIAGIRQEIDRISEFLRGLDHVTRYELLPYHPLGLSKARALHMEMPEFRAPDADTEKELEQYAFIR